MNVQFAMAHTGKRPVENGYSPFFYVETEEMRLLLHPNLHIFVEMTPSEPFAKCLHETMSADRFIREKLPFMVSAAERQKREIDEHQLQRFLSYVRQGEGENPAPARARERTRLAPDQGVSRVRERVRSSTGLDLAPLPEKPAPRVRERTRPIVAPTPPAPAPRVRTRTRG